jgi:anti-anti-sigma factor
MDVDGFAPDSGVAIVRLSGAPDGATATRVRSDLASALGGSTRIRRDPLVVDLSAVTSIDAAILAVLIDTLSECEKHERPLFLLVPDEAEPVRRLFDISGLARLLPVVRSWDEVRRRSSSSQPTAPGWTSPLS